jgi:O-antigen/teichoic acid export membrane protein
MEIIQNKTKIYALISFVVLAVSGYTMQIVVNYGFGVDGLGEFNSALAYFLIASLVTTLGSNFGVLSFASNPKNKDLNIQLVILLKAFKLTLIGFFIVFILTLLFVEFVNFSYLKNNFSMVYLSVGTLFFGLNKVLLSFINALNQMSRYYVLQASRYIIMLSFTALFVFYFGKIESLSFVFISTEISVLLTLVILQVKKEHFTYLGHLNELKKVEIVNFNFHSLKSLPGGVIQELAVRVDIMMLTIMSSAKSVGYYSIAAMIAEGMNQILVVWRDSFSPVFAHYLHQGVHELNKFIKKVLIKAFLGFSLLLILTFVLYDPILQLMFGKEITMYSKVPYGILILGLFGAIPFTLLQLLPNQFGKPGIMSLITLVSVIVNIVCNYLFIPIWGMNGAAIATALSWFVGSIGIIGFLLRFYKYV